MILSKEGSCSLRSGLCAACSKHEKRDPYTLSGQGGFMLSPNGRCAYVSFATIRGLYGERQGPGLSSRLDDSSYSVGLKVLDHGRC